MWLIKGEAAAVNYRTTEGGGTFATAGQPLSD